MKCGIIVRVSGPKQKENWSVGSQRKLGIEYARSQNWDYELYDEVASAKNIEGREQFSKLINDIQDKEIHAVWAVEFQRITRDDEDTAFFKKLCIEYNVRIIILNEELKFSTPEDEMFFTIRGAVSKYERRKTIERVKRVDFPSISRHFPATIVAKGGSRGSRSLFGRVQTGSGQASRRRCPSSRGSSRSAGRFEQVDLYLAP